MHTKFHTQFKSQKYIIIILKKIKIQKPINLPIQTLNSIHITPKKKKIPTRKETVNKQNQQKKPIPLKHKYNPNNHSHNDIKPKINLEEIKWE